MSFNIVAAGKLDEVREKVANTNVHGNVAGVAAKQFLGEILAMSGSSTLFVEASGHSGTEPGGHVSVQITVKPVA
jgi:hypothetical protein